MQKLLTWSTKVYDLDGALERYQRWVNGLIGDRVTPDGQEDQFTIIRIINAQFISSGNRFAGAALVEIATVINGVVEEAVDGSTLLVQDEADDLKHQRDVAYHERNRVVALLAKVAVKLGWLAGLRQHEPESDDWDDDWRNVVFIELPTGQISWHIHKSELELFDFLPSYDKPWDGHTTEEKHDRMDRCIF